MRFISAAAFAVFGTAALFVSGAGGRPTIFGGVLLVLLAAKMLLSQTSRPVQGPAPAGFLVGILPFYNEDPAALEDALRSILNQTRRPDRVYVVDDGSTDPAALRIAGNLASLFTDAGVDYRVISQPGNLGKREALAVGFRDPDATHFLCVDSDTVLQPDAAEEVLRAFSAPDVTAATGLVLAGNHRVNLLTRLIDLRYANAFLFERAAYSRVGAVLCCCGSLTIYRADVVRKYLDDFLNQRFLGKPAVFGDDRRLTNYALLEGRVLLQESALAETAVPQRLGHYLRQQIRWNKSFFRESLWVIRRMPRHKVAFYLAWVELASWITFTTLLLLALLVRPIQTGTVLVGTYSLFVTAMAYARSVRYFDVVRPGVGRRERLGVFLLAPAYGLLHLLVLLPLRAYSLLTITGGKWGTREQVEVVADRQVTNPLGRLTARHLKG